MISLRFSSPTILSTDDALEQHTGVISRICNFKYGFLQSGSHENIFFHFSELSDDAKATCEPGCKVTFYIKENEWASDKKMKAVKIQVTSTPEENAFKNLEGTIQGDMKARGFCFIDANGSTYLFHSTNLVNDDASKAAGNTVKAGHKVTFDAEWNHKYNPPKPFATNVRIIPGQEDFCGDCRVSESAGTWIRGSRLNLIDEDENADYTNSISPAGRPSGSGMDRGSITRRTSVSDRASALKENRPARRWSRTTHLSGSAKSDKPSGGLRMTETTCKFGRKCNRNDCWFDHPNGRQTEDGRVSTSDDDSDDSADEVKVASMGKASLRLLVNALVKESGKTGYLTIRNTLQKAEYVGRELTREEKNSVGEILEELDGSSIISVESAPETTGNWRSSSTSRLGSRSSFKGARISLSDLCRDPSLHSRLSAANGHAACP